eukprot:s2863_g3.t1
MQLPREPIIGAIFKAGLSRELPSHRGVHWRLKPEEKEVARTIPIPYLALSCVLEAMDGEAADGNALSDADGFDDLKTMLQRPHPPGWPGFLQGEDMVQRGGLFDDERLAFDVGSAVAEQVIAQQAGRGDLQDGNALAPTGIARPETPLMAYVDRASFPGFLDETEFKCCSPDAE